MKRKISLLLIVMLILTMMPQIAIEAVASEGGSTNSVDKGICGDNLKWELDSEGTLVISGKGDMYDNPQIRNQQKVKKIIIQEGVTSIGKGSFSNCDNLTGELKLPSTLEKIGDYAFMQCEGLTGDLVIPNSVTSIGSNAFKGCLGLNGNLILPDSIKSIGDSAFINCSNLKGNLILPKYMDEIQPYVFYGCSGFTGDLVIPNSVKIIDKYAFYKCEGFNGKLKLSDNLIAIKNSAFLGCKNFKCDLVIPSSVKNIGEYAFKNCIGFNDSINILGYLEYLGKGVFEGIKFKSIAILNDIDVLDKNAFDNLDAKYYIRKNTKIEKNLNEFFKRYYIKKAKLDNHYWTEEYLIDEPSCIIEGQRYRYCPICKSRKEITIYDKLPHKMTFVERKESNCAESGNIAHYYCSKCSKKYADKEGKRVYNDQETIIPMKRHIFGSWKISIKPTYAKEGLSVRKCKCGKIETKKVDRLMLPAPINVKARLSKNPGGYDDIDIYWNKVKNASGYFMYSVDLTKKEKWGPYLITSKNSVTLKNFKDGHKYKFKVVPYYRYKGKFYESNNYKAVSIYTLKKLSTPKVKKYKSGKVKVLWKDIAGQSGYQISKSTSKKKTSIVSTYKTIKGKSKVIKAKRKKGYYYKVRAYTYTKVGGKTYKVYGPWSTAKYYKLK